MEPTAVCEIMAVDQRLLEPLVMRLQTGRTESPRPTFNANLSNYRNLLIEGRPYDLVNDVAVLPLRGYLGKRGWWCDTSFDEFSALIRYALNDSAVRVILIDCHSPGGTTYGCADCADVVYEANQYKPVVCCINDLCASAALWVGSAARQIVITQSADVGSIGVFMLRMDVTEALKKQGISVDIIRAGAQKAWGSPYLPMSDGERKSFQQQVDDLYENFIAAVARNRRVHPDKVRTQWADARMFSGRQAVEVGLADHVGTFEGVLAACGVRPLSNNQQVQAAIPKERPVARRLVQQFMEIRTHPDGTKTYRRITR